MTADPRFNHMRIRTTRDRANIRGTETENIIMQAEERILALYRDIRETRTAGHSKDYIQGGIKALDVVMDVLEEMLEEHQDLVSLRQQRDQRPVTFAPSVHPPATPTPKRTR